MRNELLDTDRKVTLNQQEINCPIINVRINGCRIKMLIDTGSQVTVLSNKWVQQNKKYFKQTAILPVNNINVITAMNKSCLLYTSRNFGV